jgi:hypothetical protein
MCDSLSIACTKSGKKLNQFFVFFLDFAQRDELLDDLRSNLVLQKLEIVTEEFFNCALCIDVIFLVSFHCLIH